MVADNFLTSLQGAMKKANDLAQQAEAQACAQGQHWDPVTQKCVPDVEEQYGPPAPTISSGAAAAPSSAVNTAMSNPAVSPTLLPSGVPPGAPQGNIDLNNRPVVRNGNDVSTVRSISIEEDGKQILIPTVSEDGRLLTNQEAIDQYHRTGKNLGIFPTVGAANQYADALHNAQAARYTGPTIGTAPTANATAGASAQEVYGPPAPAQGGGGLLHTLGNAAGDVLHAAGQAPIARVLPNGIGQGLDIGLRGAQGALSVLQGGSPSQAITAAAQAPTIASAPQTYLQGQGAVSNTLGNAAAPVTNRVPIVGTALNQSVRQLPYVAFPGTGLAMTGAAALASGFGGEGTKAIGIGRMPGQFVGPLAAPALTGGIKGLAAVASSIKEQAPSDLAAQLKDATVQTVAKTIAQAKDPQDVINTVKQLDYAQRMALTLEIGKSDKTKMLELGKLLNASEAGDIKAAQQLQSGYFRDTAVVSKRASAMSKAMDALGSNAPVSQAVEGGASGGFVPSNPIERALGRSLTQGEQDYIKTLPPDRLQQLMTEATARPLADAAQAREMGPLTPAPEAPAAPHTPQDFVATPEGGLKNVSGAQGLSGDKLPPPPTTGTQATFGPQWEPGQNFAQKALGTAIDAFNAPRGLLASLDYSYPLRQGWLAMRHGKEWAQAFGAGLKAWTNDAYAAETLNRLASQDRGTLQITGLGQNLSAREEQFLSRWINKVPGVRRSQQAATVFINKLRADVYDNITQSWTNRGVNATQADFDKLGNYVNAMTGRGNLGNFENAATDLATAMFSPRLMVGRVQAPLYMFSSSSLVRQEAIKDFLTVFGATGALLALGHQAGAFDLNLNPTSSDFGKIRVGDTRIDPWGGYQQMARFTAQVATGKTTTLAGVTHKQDLGQTIWNFMRSKAAPGPSFLIDAKTGKSFTGEDINLAPASVKQQFYEHFMPLFWQDMITAIKDEGVKGGLLTTPEFFGSGGYTIPNSGQTSNGSAVQDWLKGVGQGGSGNSSVQSWLNGGQ